MLLEYIQKKHENSWKNVLYDANVFSEYCIYGIYIDEVLKPNELKIIDKSIFKGIWNRDDFNQFVTGKLSLDRNTFCIVVQSNLSIPVESYKNYFNAFLEKAPQNYLEAKTAISYL